MKNALIFLVLLTAISCSDIKPKSVTVYFSIDSLMNDQAALLIENEASLQKEAVANGDTAVSEMKPDSLSWANEFQIIRDLDINKPALIGQYRISEGEDNNSNLKILEYRAKNSALEVQTLEIYYLNKLENIKKIKVKALQSNSIFKSKKELEMKLDRIDGNLQIKEYRIHGFQKMILQDSVIFDVLGRVQY